MLAKARHDGKMTPQLSGPTWLVRRATVGKLGRLRTGFALECMPVSVVAPTPVNTVLPQTSNDHSICSATFGDFVHFDTFNPSRFERGLADMTVLTAVSPSNITQDVVVRDFLWTL